MQSPRFQAILRVTSGRKKRTHDIKSFSHELNSKGVRPFPVWKSRAFGHMEVNLNLYYKFLCLIVFYFVLCPISLNCVAVVKLSRRLWWRSGQDLRG